ncbi:MAG: metal-sulfur cluster assembly factor, partial [Verrucomicrobiae bacterium]|nr:metal-sulfur cluster assembly factor [Verrucomicrobiae bacterium]
PIAGKLTLQVAGLGLVQVSPRDLDAILKDGRPITAPALTASAQHAPIDEKEVWDALKNCYDPEIPVNIVDLGLIYDVKISEGRVDVKMTLTALGCPMAGAIALQVKDKLLNCRGVRDANVQIVWDPPWTPAMMSDDARKRLGFW